MRKLLINPYLMFGFTFFYVIFSFGLELSGLYNDINSITLNLLFYLFIVVSLFLGALSYFTFLRKDKFIYSLTFLRNNKTIKQ